MTNIKHTIQLFSDISNPSCEFCERSFRVNEEGNYSEVINHYLQQHSCQLLHVGSYTDRDSEGDLWYGTTFFIGSEVTPLPKSIPTIDANILVDLSK